MNSFLINVWRLVAGIFPSVKPIEVSMNKLVLEYSLDDLKARQKYRHKVVRFIGEVRAFAIDDMGNPNIIFSSISLIVGSVKVLFQIPERLNELKKINIGDHVVVTAICVGLFTPSEMKTMDLLTRIELVLVINGFNGTKIELASNQKKSSFVNDKFPREVEEFSKKFNDAQYGFPNKPSTSAESKPDKSTKTEE